MGSRIEDLWSALTEPGRLARWIAEVEGDLRLGGEFRARFTSQWEGTGRVEACEPPRRLLVVTRQTGETEEQAIEATLTADGDQTVLVIEERGLPVDHLRDHGAGWQVHVEDLAAHLAGRERCDIEARWEELAPGLPGARGRVVVIEPVNVFAGETLAGRLDVAAAAGSSEMAMYIYDIAPGASSSTRRQASPSQERSDSSRQPS